MKKMKIYFTLFIGICLAFYWGCKKDENTSKKNPVITWENPADITYGTLLSASQLNASANVPGTFVYTPAIGTQLNVGTNQALKVDFTPTDQNNYNSVSKIVMINVTQIVKKDPIITWTNPPDITYGTLLSASQLNATADVPGTFVYTPAIGTQLNVGTNQALKVDFSPTDQTNYNSGSKTVLINVINTINLNLDGIWDRGDIEITISGASGTFSEITSGNWLIASNSGFVTIGSQKLKNIAKTGELTWSSLELCMCIVSGVVKQIDWSSSTNIAMSSDGKSISLTSDLPASTDCTATPAWASTYTRKGSKKSSNIPLILYDRQ